MVNMKKLFIFIVFAVFLLYSCGESDPDRPDRQSFDWDLRGTWVSNDPSVYDGELVIDYNSIIIWDYLESQTPENGDDTRRPFRDFTRGAQLTGFSQNDSIFIRDAGVWQKGIPYTYYHTEGYPRIYFLRLTFGDRIEILRKVAD